MSDSIHQRVARVITETIDPSGGDIHLSAKELDIRIHHAALTLADRRLLIPDLKIISDVESLRALHPKDQVVAADGMCWEAGLLAKETNAETELPAVVFADGTAAEAANELRTEWLERTK